jgi:putative PEP-CTERM system histidine kinase
VTADTFPIATSASYGLALAGYLAFALRVALRSRENPRAGRLFVALSATALWSGACIAVALAPGAWSMRASALADALRLGAWFLFVSHLLRRPSKGAHDSSTRIFATAIVAGLLMVSVVLGEGFPFNRLLGDDGPRVGFLVRLGLSVFGLILVEQLVRRVKPQLRWAIKPLAIALAGVFGLELLLYADAMLFGQLDADIWVSRGFANVLVIPFLVVATVRNTDWTVDLHLSREAVFHSSALLISGGFLLAIAVAGYYVRYVGGDWGRALQIELLFAALLLVTVVAWSGRFRSKLKVFVSKHFFSYRYDYRHEWLRFTHTLSHDDATQGLQERTVMAIAALVESPAGAVWIRQDGRGYALGGRWNVPMIEAVERDDGEFVRFLVSTGWIVDVAELRSDPDRYAGMQFPAWLDHFPTPWLVVPLNSGGDLEGFVVLSAPRTHVEVDWEVRDLLKTASRQAASFLAQGRATEALLEARKFDAFNRMSAFVVHDLKNLVAQLSLMLRNAQRHRDNPAFQADMLATVEHVVGRMNGLMLQLRAGANPVENPHPLDLAVVVRRVCGAKAWRPDAIALEISGPVLIMGHEDRLEHVIGHILQNALDATPGNRGVKVRLELAATSACVVVIDEGVGMSEAFVRERLFKPFHTTKSAGMGIGVYESSQYVSSLGGEIAVASELGIGTTVRIRLPRLADGENEATALKEQVA